jgi:hypothetical protein
LKTHKVLILAVTLAIASSHRLPAPVIEESQTPAPEETGNRKKSKPKTSAVDLGSPGQARIAKTSAPIPPKKFAGTWSGVMPEVPWGDVQTELVVDQTETTMSWGDVGKKKTFAKTQLSGDTISARFPAGFTTAVWYITPRADGGANVRLTAFMNDQTAVFQKQSTSPLATAPATAPAPTPATAPAQSSGEIPMAKPVPGKAGFVYSPFDPNETRYLDVRGHASGTKVKDPGSGRLFIVP